MAAGYNRPRSGASGRVRLEDRLVLLGWLHNQLGYDSTAELLSDTKSIQTGFGADGRSHVYNRLISKDMSESFRDKLKEYDG